MTRTEKVILFPLDIEKEREREKTKTFASPNRHFLWPWADEACESQKICWIECLPESPS